MSDEATIPVQDEPINDIPGEPIVARIRSLAIEILTENPGGIRYADLRRSIHEKNNALNLNTIAGAIWNLDTLYETVEKPSRGLFRVRQTELTTDVVDAIPQPGVTENDFYLPFADWLKNDLEDVTVAIPLGGNRFKDKWGTPDVIGKKAPRPSDIIKPSLEIVSAEIKTNTNQLITAFGQACAYCLFSHRSFLVIPKQAAPDEISRLDSLCQIFGIGLILFDASSSEDPKFEVRTRPRKHEPDTHYTNRYMKIIESTLFG